MSRVFSCHGRIDKSITANLCHVVLSLTSSRLWRDEGDSVLFSSCDLTCGFCALFSLSTLSGFFSRCHHEILLDGFEISVVDIVLDPDQAWSTRGEPAQKGTWPNGIENRDFVAELNHR